MERKVKIIEVNDIMTNDGKKFKVYKTVGKGGRKMDVRFTRDCSNVPTKPCVVVVNEENCDVDTTRQYPILWIKSVERIEGFERKNNTSDYFDAK